MNVLLDNSQTTFPGLSVIIRAVPFGTFWDPTRARIDIVNVKSFARDKTDKVTGLFIDKLTGAKPGYDAIGTKLQKALGPASITNI